ncbi:MAG: 7-cyano-7-deazaguanine synthase QueC [Candidatus Altiarchaeia archaeon]
MKKAVCLLSGGMDSAVAAAIAKKQGYEIYALSFDYGQRHKKELECARMIACFLDVKEHRILKIDLRGIGGSALTSCVDVPVGKDVSKIKENKEIPITYVPARNTIMLSFALAYAEVAGAEAIYIGANCVDYSGYPDCRQEYFEKFQEMADLATKRTVGGKMIRIETPIIKLDKAGIVRKGMELNVPFKDTWSCYLGGGKACGRCDSCVLRLNGFIEAGVVDPIPYE